QGRERLEAARGQHEAASRQLEQARIDAERALGEMARWADRVRAGAVQRSAAAAEVATLRAEAREAAAARDELERQASETGVIDLETRVSELRDAEQAARLQLEADDTALRAARDHLAAARATAVRLREEADRAASRLRL